MKKATLFSIAILMFVSFSMPSNAAFRLHPTVSPVSFNTAPINNDKSEKSDTKPVKKKTGVFGIIAISAAVVGCLMPAAGAIFAIILGIGGGVFGIMGLGKKRKLKGLAIAGLILGVIAIAGGIILLG